MLGIWHECDYLKEIFGSAQSMVEWYMEAPDLVGFRYVNTSYFPLIFHQYLYLLLCGFDGCSIIFIILVMCYL